MYLKKSLLIAATVLAAVYFSATAFAEEDGEIKYRQAVMKAIGGHMGAIVGILKGENSNETHLTVHTQAMAALSNITGTLFPKGSDSGETNALPVIWERPAEFSMAVKNFQNTAAGLNAAAMSGDMSMVGAALGGLGKSCKNCHENFRKRQN